MRWCIALILLAMASALPAAADQTDQRLDQLFARLGQPETADALRVEATIWQIWWITRTEEAIRPFHRGMDALGEGRVADALALFDDVVAKAPDFAEGWNKRATALFLLGRNDESAADIARTLALEPRHFGAWAGLGLIRLARGQEAEALAAFERGLAVNPHMPNIAAVARELRSKVRGRAI